jgi:ABC-type Mn2+/Zn2+ transport system permease subunit
MNNWFFYGIQIGLGVALICGLMGCYLFWRDEIRGKRKP